MPCTLPALSLPSACPLPAASAVAPALPGPCCRPHAPSAAWLHALHQAACVPVRISHALATPAAQRAQPALPPNSSPRGQVHPPPLLPLARTPCGYRYAIKAPLQSPLLPPHGTFHKVLAEHWTHKRSAILAQLRAAADLRSAACAQNGTAANGVQQPRAWNLAPLVAEVRPARSARAQPLAMHAALRSHCIATRRRGLHDRSPPTRTCPAPLTHACVTMACTSKPRRDDADGAMHAHGQQLTRGGPSDLSTAAGAGPRGTQVLMWRQHPAALAASAAQSTE
jgi:hypothetical protein